MYRTPPGGGQPAGVVAAEPNGADSTGPTSIGERSEAAATFGWTARASSATASGSTEGLKWVRRSMPQRASRARWRGRPGRTGGPGEERGGGRGGGGEGGRARGSGAGQGRGGASARGRERWATQRSARDLGRELDGEVDVDDDRAALKPAG